jgi:hypothetical protein
VASSWLDSAGTSTLVSPPTGRTLPESTQARGEQLKGTPPSGDSAAGAVGHQFPARARALPQAGAQLTSQPASGLIPAAMRADRNKSGNQGPSAAIPQPFRYGLCTDRTKRAGDANAPAAVPRANHKPPGQCSGCPYRESPGAVPRLQIMAQKERVEFRASSAFVDRLDNLAATMQVSKAEVIRAAIDTLEMVVSADRQGQGITFVPKKQSNATKEPNGNPASPPVLSS